MAPLSHQRSACIQVLGAALLLTLLSVSAAAADHYGQVTFSGLAVPGATITASQGDRRMVTSTDPQGSYRLESAADGVWTITVEMVGFSTLERQVTIAADASPSAWELTLLPFDELTRSIEVTRPSASPATGASAPAAPSEAGSRTSASPSSPQGFRRAGVNPSAAAPPARPDAGASPQPAGTDAAMGAADGFLINGSVNNGAASPFAQMRAFGNNRPGQRSLYTGGIGLLAGNSAWDARPYTFAGEQSSKPSYNDVHLIGSFGGPFKIPRIVRNAANLFLGYQHIEEHNASAQSALMPTALERAGDFSQTRDAAGRQVQVIDPLTGLPFADGVIPRERLSPQAQSLLGYYPAPNVSGDGRFNFQRPVISEMKQDVIQTRATQPIDMRNQLAGTFSYQRTITDASSLFGFEDSFEVSGMEGTVNWQHRFSQFLSLRLRYQYTRLTNRTTPYFSGRTNVSGEAGIAGNNQEPINWGPPGLTFANGLAGLSDVLPALTRSQTNGWSAETYLYRGRHNVTVGGGLRANHIDIQSQQDPRGAFSFTGALTGVDFADFLLGVPHSSSIAFGNADKYLRAFSYDAYVSDDWRVSPSLTVTAGIRWEYESPITERLDRLVNLDIASGFTAISPIVASDPVGDTTGAHYPSSLLNPDMSGVQPRIGVAWRPVAGSSLVVRAGYGIYRNTAVYQSIATALAQQPPLSNAFSIENSAANPLTLANGFVAPAGTTLNTFAVDPDFRVGYAHNWQVSAQRDLPGSLNIMATYLGTRGRRLMQEFLPNTYPDGIVDPCASCPSGFVYLTSSGHSTRHAGQLQFRRRLRNGFTATMMYTLAKAMDDAAAFAGASLNGASVAQDWMNLEAEFAPSNFDQRHLVTAQFEYTTGVGVRGGGLLSGWKGRLFKNWAFTSQLNTGSGFPLTPLYLTTVAGTGVTGTIRADVTGESAVPPEGYYLNPASYAPPAQGRWGTAGRNSATGPMQFSLNAGVGRTFPWGQRLSLDWRIDALNVLNRVTYAAVNALVGSPQFGLPTRANPMRKIQTSLRLRF